MPTTKRLNSWAVSLMAGGRLAAVVAAIAIALAGVVSRDASAISLQEALQITVSTNPNISEAIFSRRATEFELEQARGLWGPQVDLEAQAGIEYVDNPTTRAPTINKDYTPTEIGVRVRQRIFDSGEANAEIYRQAARVDGAAYRVLERSEFIALETSRAYIDMLRYASLESVALENLRFHRSILSDVRTGAGRGVLSVADVDQVEERIHAAEVRLAQYREERAIAEADFIELVGRPPHRLSGVPSLANSIPGSSDGAIDVARRDNPLIALRTRDIDAARALIDRAESEFGPDVNLELNSSVGNDIDRRSGSSAEAQALLSMSWTIYDHGIRRAARNEQVERASEARMRLHIASREVEREIRAAWAQRVWLGEQIARLNQELAVGRRLLDAYQEQFGVGERSLLDVLDTQNSLSGVQASLVTASYVRTYSEYRIVAAMGRLLSAFNLRPPSDAEANVGTEFGVTETPLSETMPRDRWDFVRDSR